MKPSPMGPHQARRILRSRGIRPRKRFGQNFLTDSNTARKLVGTISPGVDEVFLEIGAGIGALTLPLAESGARVFAVEVDPKLTPLLEAAIADFENVRVMEQDILHVEVPQILQTANARQIQVIGNLPYNITTQIVLYLIENRAHIGRVLITLQREYAERLLARPGTRPYSSISVLVQFYFEAKRVMTISPSCFFPEPDVASSVLRLQLRAEPAAPVKNERVFRAVVRAAFSHRRKMLLNSMAEWLGLGKPFVRQLLEAAGVEVTRRAEQLRLEELARVADVFYDEEIELRPDCGSHDGV